VLMKVIVLALGVISTLGIARVAEDRGLSPGREVMLALWNPLVIAALPLGGHADIAIVAGVIWAIAADRRGRPLLATLALTAASLVKAYAAVVLLVYLLALLRRRLQIAVAAAGLAAGVTILAWLPFWQGVRTLKGLGEIAGRASASLGGQIQLLLGELVGKDTAGLTVRIVGVAIVASVIVRFARLRTFSEDPWPAAAAAFLAYIVVTPWFLYWHLIGPLVLAALAGTSVVRAAAFTLSGTVMLTASFGSTSWGRFVQTALRYAPPAVAGLRAGKRSGTGGTPPRSPRPRRSSA
jgi:alpha-1,6-mannosyltransferase